jgi:hypothetical protein
MGSPSRRSEIVATTVLSWWWMLFAEPTFAQQDGPGSAASPSLDPPVGPGDSSSFDDPDRGLGLYIQTGLGDGNPNPVRWFLSVALCWNSPLPDREGDTFGIGFYDLGPSAQAKSQAPGLRDEYGVELLFVYRLGAALSGGFNRTSNAG